MHETDETTITSRRSDRALVALWRRRSISSLMEESFFDIRVRLGDIRLRLVIVVVGNEVFHGVFREKLAEFRAQLSRERFVVREHERGAVDVGDDVRHGEEVLPEP